MKLTAVLGASVSASALVLALGVRSAAAAGSVSSYSIDDPEYGACRLKGVDESSDNFKYYASVSGQDATLNEACTRCIEVTVDGDDSLSVTAYVLDVCDGCSSGTVELSSDALAELSLNSSTVSSTAVSWDYVTCPSSLLSGDVKACLMEGASSSYIPLQFYNSQKVITAVTIDGVNATSTDDTYLWYANPGTESTTWYKSIEVSMASADGENKTSTFAFTSTSGCATSDVQFSVASTSNGVDGSTSGGTSSGSSSSSAGLIGGIVAAVVVVLLIIGSVILYKRRRRSSQNSETPNDVEGGYLSPKKRAATGTAANEEHSVHDNGSVQEPRSPTMEYTESFTPAAALNKPTGIDREIDTEDVPETAVAAAMAATAFSHDDSTSTTSSQRGVRPSSHLSFGTESPASPSASAVSSDHHSSNRSAPSLSVEPTFRYSSRDMYGAPAVPNPQKTAFSQQPAPTLAAPVIPASMAANLHYEDDDDRGSFDVDDMRDTEEMKTGEPAEQSFDERQSRPYSSQAYYGAPETYADSAVTSPQSYVRATTLRRNTGSQRKPNPSMLASRSSSRYNNNSTMFSDAPQPEAYAAAPPRSADPTPSYTPQSGPYSAPYSDSSSSFAPQDSYGSQRNVGSFRESAGASGGYSRDSLNILGYPYSKRSQRHNNMNG
jgi:hypothetical protein